MIRTANFTGRIVRLESAMAALRLEALLVTNQTNVSYLSGFPGQDSVLLITKKKRYFLTDSRYLEDAAHAVKGFDIELVKDSTYKAIARLAKADRLKRIGFESMNLPFGVAERLKEMIRTAGLTPAKGLVEGLRALKDDAEIELIKRSARLAKEVLARIIKLARPGAREEYLAREAELEFIRRGAHPAFEPIVASGANSSKPHARPSGARIRKGSVVMVDMGCNLNGYNSDITRMAFTGKAKGRFKKIYEIVKDAQALAIEKIRPGKKASEIDFSARAYIHKNGFGKYFSHSLGHGVGLDVHEEPAISRANEKALEPGMVFTVEPAIYIPRFGGVRVEDMVLVTDRGCEVLT